MNPILRGLVFVVAIVSRIVVQAVAVIAEYKCEISAGFRIKDYLLEPDDPNEKEI